MSLRVAVLVLVISSLSLPGKLCAAEPVDLPSSNGGFLGFRAAIQIALANRPLIKKAQAASMAAQAVADQSKGRFYPQVDAYAVQTAGTARPGSGFNISGVQTRPTAYAQNAGLRADQLLYDFGQTAHRVLAERAESEATEKTVLINKALVILEVQQAYIECLRLQRLVQIAQQTVQERGTIRSHVTALYEQQLKSKLDVNLISVELRQAEVQLSQASNQLRTAFAELNHALGVPGREFYTLEEVEDPPGGSETLESLIQQGMSDRPELMQSDDRIRAAGAQVQAARALNWPTISAIGLSGVVHVSDTPAGQYSGIQDGQTHLWWGAAAIVSVPLFTGFYIEHRVAESLERKYQEEKRRQDLANRVVEQITESYFAVQTARQQAQVEQHAVNAARSALTLAKERYRLGLASVVDMTTATTDLMAAEVRLAEARYAVQANTRAASYAVGKGYRQY